MKSPIILIISLFLVASCSQKENPETSLRVQSLEQEVAGLTLENTNLKVENDLCKTWWKPKTIKKSSTGWLKKIDPQIIEGGFAGCMKVAHEIYIAQSVDYCKKAGYTDEDMAADKCQLSNTIVKKIESTKVKAQSECYTLYK